MDWFRLAIISEGRHSSVSRQVLNQQFLRDKHELQKQVDLERRSVRSEASRLFPSSQKIEVPSSQCFNGTQKDEDRSKSSSRKLKLEVLVRTYYLVRKGGKRTLQEKGTGSSVEWEVRLLLRVLRSSIEYDVE
ncbi:hypothetical protein E4U48_007868 [Claviceps purpurea]|nr:hypothetical protein E4U48_007868 [Claviceps purpurea]